MGILHVKNLAMNLAAVRASILQLLYVQVSCISVIPFMHWIAYTVATCKTL